MPQPQQRRRYYNLGADVQKIPNPWMHPHAALPTGVLGSPTHTRSPWCLASRLHALDFRVRVHMSIRYRSEHAAFFVSFQTTSPACMEAESTRHLDCMIRPEIRSFNQYILVVRLQPLRPSFPIVERSDIAICTQENSIYPYLCRHAGQNLLRGPARPSSLHRWRKVRACVLDGAY